jgi:hypothetical protein
MQVEVPEEGTTEDHEQIQVSGDRPLGVIHSGDRYAFGYGPDFYGIWDSASSAPPTERFPATDEGRQAGWARYLELEPSASGTVITRTNPDLVWRREVERRKRQRRRKSLITVTVILVLVIGGGVALALSTGGGGATVDTGLTDAAKAKKAHVDITGAQTFSEDLPQDDFRTTSGLVGASVVGTWKGTQTELTVDVHSPLVGTMNTTEIPPRTVKLTLMQPDGSTVSITSNHGECKVTIDAFGDQGFAGTFTCTGLALPNDGGTIDAEGDFGASQAQTP